MKKIILLALLIVIKATTSQAQITTKPVKNVQKTTVTETNVIPPPPPPATTNKTGAASNQNTPVYTLTSARVNIKTGNDNKEFPSEVFFQLSNGVAFIMQQRGENMRNEMKINSNTEFGLEKNGGVSSEGFTLESMKKKGINLRIVYFPNFLMDAWKIEGVSITLEFRDQNGTPHPTLGSKTIVFNNATGFLDAINKTLLCKTDEQLNPTTSSILDK
jgi:hypothetical protein